MVAVGKIGSLFGDGGGLVVALYDGFSDRFDMEEPVFVEIDGHRVPLFFDELRRRGVRGAVVRFADIDTADRARELLGLEFCLLPARVTNDSSRAGGVSTAANRVSFGTTTAAEPETFDEVIGWEVKIGGEMGRITDFFDSAMNPLLEIEIGGARELIPAQAEFVAEIDARNRRLILDLPEGLMGLNS